MLYNKRRPIILLLFAILLPNQVILKVADGMKASPSSSPISKAIAATAKAKNVVVFTGAGMSADSGIGTFRGEGGAWSGFFGNLALLWGGTPIGWKWTPWLVWPKMYPSPAVRGLRCRRPCWWRSLPRRRPGRCLRRCRRRDF